MPNFSPASVGLFGSLGGLVGLAIRVSLRTFEGGVKAVQQTQGDAQPSEIAAFTRTLAYEPFKSLSTFTSAADIELIDLPSLPPTPGHCMPADLHTLTWLLICLSAFLLMPVIARIFSRTHFSPNRPPAYRGLLTGFFFALLLTVLANQLPEFDFWSAIPSLIEDLITASLQVATGDDAFAVLSSLGIITAHSPQPKRPFIRRHIYTLQLGAATSPATRYLARKKRRVVTGSKKPKVTSLDLQGSTGTIFTWPSEATSTQDSATEAVKTVDNPRKPLELKDVENPPPPSTEPQSTLALPTKPAMTDKQVGSDSPYTEDEVLVDGLAYSYDEITNEMTDLRNKAEAKMPGNFVDKAKLQKAESELAKAKAIILRISKKADELEEQGKRKIDELERRIKDLSNAANVSSEKKNDDLHKALADAERKHLNAIAAVKEEAQTARDAAKEAKRARDEVDTQWSKVKRSMKTLQSQVSRLEDENDELKNNHPLALEAATDSHQSALEAAAKSHQSAFEAAAQSHQSALEAATKSHQSALEAAIKSHQSASEAAAKALNAEKDSNSKLMQEVEQLRQENEKLLHGRQALHAETTNAIQSSRAEVEEYKGKMESASAAESRMSLELQDIQQQLGQATQDLATMVTRENAASDEFTSFKSTLTAAGEQLAKSQAEAADSLAQVAEARAGAAHWQAQASEWQATAARTQASLERLEEAHSKCEDDPLGDLEMMAADSSPEDDSMSDADDDDSGHEDSIMSDSAAPDDGALVPQMLAPINLDPSYIPLDREVAMSEADTAVAGTNARNIQPPVSSPALPNTVAGLTIWELRRMAASGRSRVRAPSSSSIKPEGPHPWEQLPRINAAAARSERGSAATVPRSEFTFSFGHPPRRPSLAPSGAHQIVIPIMPIKAPGTYLSGSASSSGQAKTSEAARPGIPGLRPPATLRPAGTLIGRAPPITVAGTTRSRGSVSPCRLMSSLTTCRRSLFGLGDWGEVVDGREGALAFGRCGRN